MHFTVATPTFSADFARLLLVGLDYCSLDLTISSRAGQSTIILYTASKCARCLLVQWIQADGAVSFSLRPILHPILIPPIPSLSIFSQSSSPFLSLFVHYLDCSATRDISKRRNGSYPIGSPSVIYPPHSSPLSSLQEERHPTTKT